MIALGISYHELFLYLYAIDAGFAYEPSLRDSNYTHFIRQ